MAVIYRHVKCLIITNDLHYRSKEPRYNYILYARGRPIANKFFFTFTLTETKNVASSLPPSTTSLILNFILENSGFRRHVCLQKCMSRRNFKLAFSINRINANTRLQWNSRYVFQYRLLFYFLFFSVASSPPSFLCHILSVSYETSRVNEFICIFQSTASMPTNNFNEMLCVPGVSPIVLPFRFFLP